MITIILIKIILIKNIINDKNYIIINKDTFCCENINKNYYNNNSNSYYNNHKNNNIIVKIKNN